MEQIEIQKRNNDSKVRNCPNLPMNPFQGNEFALWTHSPHSFPKEIIHIIQGNSMYSVRWRYITKKTQEPVNWAETLGPL